MLQLTGTPDERSLFIGPLLKGSGDGMTMILFSTGSSNDSTGNLYLASLDDVASGRKDLVIIPIQSAKMMLKKKQKQKKDNVLNSHLTYAFLTDVLGP